MVVVRPSTADDLPFIFKTYLDTWRVSKFAGTMPNHLYYETQRQAFEQLLGRGAKLYVACPESDPHEIYGWTCAEVKEGRTVLHYLYVRDCPPDFKVVERLWEAMPGAKPGFLTHRLFHVLLKDWTHTPEIARRKSL